MPVLDVSAIAFDFDGTLVQLTIDFGRMRQEVTDVVRSYGVEEPEILDMHLLELIEAASLVAGSADDGAALYRAAFDAIERIECEAARRAQVLPGIPELLLDLRAHGLALAVVTRNSERAVHIVYPTIDKDVDVFLPRESVRHVKPHPEHLELCTWLLHAPPERCAMVGDHPVDIQAGIVRGMQTVGVLTGTGTEEGFRAAGADHVLPDVTHIRRLLED